MWGADSPMRHSLMFLFFRCYACLGLGVIYHPIRLYINHTWLAVHDLKRDQSSGNWWSGKMWHTHKTKLSTVLPMTAITKQEKKINKRVFIQHFNEVAIHYPESWSSNENSRQRSAGIWPMFVAYNWNETFLWNYGMFNLVEVLWRFNN